jgi:hypothetical protein
MLRAFCSIDSYLYREAWKQLVTHATPHGGGNSSKDPLPKQKSSA